MRNIDRCIKCGIEFVVSGGLVCCGCESIPVGARLKDPPCTVCGGSGEPASGRPCVCGGTGKLFDAERNARTELIAARSELAKLREERDAVVELLAEVEQQADHGIPPYAYGDNEAACEFVHRLDQILSLVRRREEKGGE